MQLRFWRNPLFGATVSHHFFILQPHRQAAAESECFWWRQNAGGAASVDVLSLNSAKNGVSYRFSLTERVCCSSPITLDLLLYQTFKEQLKG